MAGNGISVGRLRIPASNLKKGWLIKVAQAVLAFEDVGKAEIAVTLVGERKMRQLNRRYRGEDRPTDVLAFSMREGEALITPEGSPPFLGDVVICYPKAVEQAQEAGCPVEEEVARLLIHGILHLLGYDHDTDEKEKGMKGKQEAILERLRAAPLPTA